MASMPIAADCQKIEKAVRISAPPFAVWAALTRPDLMAQWMTDEELSVAFDARAGAPIVIHGTLHGMPFENHGTVQIFEPEKAFAYNYWSTLSIARLPDHPDNYTSVRFDLTSCDDGTLLALTLSDFPDISIPQHANFYWGTTLSILKAFVERQ